MTNIIQRSFLIVETCAELSDPFLFLTEVYYSFRGLFLRITVSTATDNTHLAVGAPSFEMWPLCTIEEEFVLAGAIPKNAVNLFEFWNLFMSPIYGDKCKRVSIFVHNIQPAVTPLICHVPLQLYLLQ